MIPDALLLWRRDWTARSYGCDKILSNFAANVPREVVDCLASVDGDRMMRHSIYHHYRSMKVECLILKKNVMLTLVADCFCLEGWMYRIYMLYRRAMG